MRKTIHGYFIPSTKTHNEVHISKGFFDSANIQPNTSFADGFMSSINKQFKVHVFERVGAEARDVISHFYGKAECINKHKGRDSCLNIV